MVSIFSIFNFQMLQILQILFCIDIAVGSRTTEALDGFRETEVTGTTTFTLQTAFFPDPSVAAAVILVVPAFLGVTTPFEVTVATAVLLLVHFKVLLVAPLGAMVAFSV